MHTAKDIFQTRDIIHYWKKQDVTIGLVPTMGNINEEHIQLIRRALKENDRVVVSVFVNPLQFATREEFRAYQIDLERDLALCEEMGVHLVFCPETGVMYDRQFSSFVTCREWSEGGDGFDYYRGIFTVVVKLFNIIQPDRMYIRDKETKDADAYRRLAMDLNMNVEIVG